MREGRGRGVGVERVPAVFGFSPPSSPPRPRLALLFLLLEPPAHPSHTGTGAARRVEEWIIRRVSVVHLLLFQRARWGVPSQFFAVLATGTLFLRLGFSTCVSYK